MDEGKAGLRGAENPFPPLAAGDAQQSPNALFWCNHDQPRIVSRFGDEGNTAWRRRMLGMVLHGMQGTPYIYQVKSWV